jgi:Lipocalin-like domain
MSDPLGRNALVGAWRLISWENRADDGQVTYPMGTDVLGYLLYTADQRFAVMISRMGRGRFAADDLLSGTIEEKARAVEGFVAYAGRYSFHDDRVVHHVELSLFPNWLATDQERTVELAGDRLTLSASQMLLAGKQQVPRLVWERVDSPREGGD